MFIYFLTQNLENFTLGLGYDRIKRIKSDVFSKFSYNFLLHSMFKQ